MAISTGDDLLALVPVDPDRASRTARHILDTGADHVALSYAHQALGIVMRDRGDIETALDHLRTARRLAEGADPDRVADVRATLGVALSLRGRTPAAMRELDAAVRLSAARGPVRPKVLLRRAHVLAYLGRHLDAVADLQEAVPAFRRAGDEIWEARALNLRAYALMQRGDFTEAEQDLHGAEALFAHHEQRLEVLHTRHNLAHVRFFRGDVPGALSAFARLSAAFEDLGDPHLDVALDRARVLLTAGLSEEAVGVTTASWPWAAPRPRARADLLVTRAAAQLGAGRPDLALADAQEARRLFVRQDRQWWRIRADLVALQARTVLGRGSRRAAVALADSLREDRTEDAVLAHLIAGRELARSDPAGASAYLSRAAGGRHRGSPLSRSTAWLARALELEVQGRPRVLDAVGRGLDALAEHRATLGSPELRALTALHSEELARLAVRHALPRGPRALVRWSDRARAGSLAEPVRAPQDPAIDALLATIRGLSHRIAEEEHPGRVQELERERSRHERAVRLAWAATPADGRPSTSVADTDLVAHLGGRVLVQLVDVDGTLQAVVVRDGRWRRVEVGPRVRAAGAVDQALYGLRTATRGRPVDLDALGRRLEVALLGRVAGLLPEGRAVVVAPPTDLLAAPWGLLPVLRERAVALTPSATAWVRACRAGTTSSRAVFVVGPDLPTGGGEVQLVARMHDGAATLSGEGATVAGALSALDGAALAHVAAHGSFRAESPMFSSLHLADGALTVDDVHRLDRPPHRVVLPACRSGVVADVAGQDMIGFASALLGQGTAGVVASIADVDDAATVRVMVELHRGLAAGCRLDEALRDARVAAGSDAVWLATAVAFTALGAG
ncbi:CHAT domain-containing protein [Nocardioides sediminis]|uniref:CHAT domain-containing protein n=1 Tax=Nocardioides sediminis TaxID=433648 RepID=UPI000D3204AF|nr:CHAT domain-containing protein [Nocardioides sediminis]